MPILPLDHPEPFAAVLGVMLYPGADDSDRQRAAAFASHYLAHPIRQFHEAGGTMAQSDLMRIVAEGGGRLDDLDRRWWEATATGELFKILFALANTDPSLASWDNAIRLAEVTIARHRVTGSRSALWKMRSRFLSVAHLWAVWCLREGRFTPRPEVGYEAWHDFQSFLAEAEILRHWGQSFRQPRAKAQPPLPAEVWQVPGDWAPPERQPSWPPTGKIATLTVSDDLLVHLKKSGRPRKPR
jgi:hypothetical protein